MNRPSFLGAASSAAIISALTGVSIADAQGQLSSDQELRTAAATITGLVAQLQYERGDYGGQRKAAIDKLNDALNELDAALATVNAGKPTQGMSDAVLRHVQDRIDNLVGQLRQAKSDYGGHKGAAIRDLQGASSDLTAALNNR